MFFTKAIVKRPCREITKGLRKDFSLVPDYDLALKQHDDYIKILEECGLDVEVLQASPEYPDSTFIEDTAVLTPSFAVMTNPGAETRKGEISLVKTIIEKYYSRIYCIEEPGTVDGGDIMMADGRFYIGVSARTNNEGAGQLRAIFEKHGIQSFLVPVKRALHLKTAVNCITNNTLIMSDEFRTDDIFSDYHRILVDENDSYSANSLYVNGKVIVPSGFPSTASKIEKAGYRTVSIDISEYRKLDGGLTCLSLRF